jgi:hypothetical protein
MSGLRILVPVKRVIDYAVSLTRTSHCKRFASNLDSLHTPTHPSLTTATN